jgi:hypothetical protein
MPDYFAGLEESTYPSRAAVVHYDADAESALSSFTDAADCTVRSFYEDILGGVQVSPVGGVQADDALHFILEGQLIRLAAPDDDRHQVLELTVASPIALAERCWDAGCTVRIERGGVDGIVYITDPVGRTVALLPRGDVET